MSTITELTRNEMIQLATDKKIEHDSNISKGALMAVLIDKLGADFTVERKDQPETPMKERILQLAGEKKTTPQIVRLMEKEGYFRIRSGYVYTILRENKITVPKAERVVLSKDEYEELLKAAGRKK